METVERISQADANEELERALLRWYAAQPDRDRGDYVEKSICRLLDHARVALIQAIRLETTCPMGSRTDPAEDDESWYDLLLARVITLMARESE